MHSLTNKLHFVPQTPYRGFTLDPIGGLLSQDSLPHFTHSKYAEVSKQLCPKSPSTEKHVQEDNIIVKPQSTAFLFQCLSVAIQQGNAASITETSPRRQNLRTFCICKLVL